MFRSTHGLYNRIRAVMYYLDLGNYERSPWMGVQLINRTPGTGVLHKYPMETDLLYLTESPILT